MSEATENRELAEKPEDKNPRWRFRGIIPLIIMLLLGACTFPWTSTQDRVIDAASNWSTDCGKVTAQGAALGLKPEPCTPQVFGQAAARIMSGTGQPSVEVEPAATPAPTATQPGAGVVKIYQ